MAFLEQALILSRAKTTYRLHKKTGYESCDNVRFGWILTKCNVDAVKSYDLS